MCLCLTRAHRNDSFRALICPFSRHIPTEWARVYTVYLLYAAESLVLTAFKKRT